MKIAIILGAFLALIVLFGVFLQRMRGKALLESNIGVPASVPVKVNEPMLDADGNLELSTVATGPLLDKASGVSPVFLAVGVGVLFLVFLIGSSFAIVAYIKSARTNNTTIVDVPAVVADGSDSTPVPSALPVRPLSWAASSSVFSAPTSPSLNLSAQGDSSGTGLLAPDGTPRPPYLKDGVSVPSVSRDLNDGSLGSSFASGSVVHHDFFTLRDVLHAPVSYEAARRSDFDATPRPRSVEDKADSKPGDKDHMSALGSALNTPSANSNGSVTVKSFHKVLRRGTPIPCQLTAAINSELPGQVHCTINVAIYDGNHTGEPLIHPGAEAFGQFVAPDLGAERLLLVIDRITDYSPRGSARIIDFKIPVTDQIGQGGIGGEVNHQIWKRFGIVFLSRLASSITFNVGGQVTNQVLQVPQTQISGSDIASAYSANIPTIIKARAGEMLVLDPVTDIPFPL